MSKFLHFNDVQVNYLAALLTDEIKLSEEFRTKLEIEEILWIEVSRVYDNAYQVYAACFNPDNKKEFSHEFVLQFRANGDNAVSDLIILYA